MALGILVRLLLLDRWSHGDAFARDLERLLIYLHGKIGNGEGALLKWQIRHDDALRRGNLAIDDVSGGLGRLSSLSETFYLRKIIIAFKAVILHRHGNCPCLIFSNFIGTQGNFYLLAKYH